MSSGIVEVIIMSVRNNSASSGSGGGRRRIRMRGMLSTKTGKAIGLTSIAAPILGYVVNDLKKPDSIVRGLATAAIRKLIHSKQKEIQEIDITDKVEIIEGDASPQE